ncbi:hypothetical protein HCH_00901 [Hahella chejuensis KCTC 2396]|uniref:Uncharacterized protein n=1 Tax=Hahella chejuensis (strain KCTC 2396) TaxID=349521 RepID=Q2SNI2_HAHCH|nr:hypothetical protein HCH_00901 [Hahella chejuensis KCTC 2396]
MRRRRPRNQYAPTWEEISYVTGRKADSLQTSGYGPLLMKASYL